MSSHRSLVLACVLAALSRPVVAQAVIVLDAAGGGDATSLQAALDMAVDGDIVLVRPGQYALLADDSELTGKGLDIVGDGAGVQLGALTIRDVPATSLVRLRSVTLGPVAIQVSLTVRDCAGPVLVEDCQLVASQASAPVFSPSPPGSPALVVDASQAVTLMRCVLTGGPGADTWLVPFPVNSDPSPGGPAAHVDESDVALWQCTLTGGRGGRDDYHGNPGENGAEALLAQGSVVFLSGCLLTGGAGADDCDLPTPDLCAGGDGLVLDSTTSAVHLESTFVGGPGGVLSGGGRGLPGVDVSAAPGSLSLALPGVTRGLAATPVARELQPASITYQGSAGDFIGLFLSIDSQFVPQYVKAGVYQLGSPLLGPTVLAPVAAPSGALTIDFPAWDLTGLPIDGLSVCWQALVLASGGGLRFSAPTTFTVVDDTL